ncbi:MAG: 3'-5' exonuclease [Verrucomicrobia bacterium]|nr:3'-5' exonuclease [Verrucomicrobiota bacterium]
MNKEILPTYDLEAAAAALAASGDYRVLRRIEPSSIYCDLGEQEARKGLILDIETTGLSFEEDRIIELGIIPFEYGAETGEVGRVYPPVSFLEDPGRDLPDKIVELTGITTEMVKGKRIEDRAVQVLFDESALVIAHNAGFDRPFVDRRFEFSKGKPWACSWIEVPWSDFGFKCAKLECLLPSKSGAFVDAHRASNDCMALLHILASPFADGTVPMTILLDSARQATCRIWAVQAPFDVKDILKGRGYRWNPGENGDPKAWWVDVRETDLETELEWLKENGYSGRNGPWEVRKFSAKTRYCS